MYNAMENIALYITILKRDVDKMREWKSKKEFIRIKWGRYTIVLDDEPFEGVLEPFDVKEYSIKIGRKCQIGYSETEFFKLYMFGWYAIAYMKDTKEFTVLKKY